LATLEENSGKTKRNAPPKKTKIQKNNALGKKSLL